MSDLEDLGFTSITEMSNDEALETLRQIRLSRRVPLKTKVYKKPEKSTVSSDQAAEILKLIMGVDK